MYPVPDATPLSLISIDLDEAPPWECEVCSASNPAVASICGVCKAPKDVVAQRAESGDLSPQSPYGTVYGSNMSAAAMPYGSNMSASAISAAAIPYGSNISAASVVPYGSNISAGQYGSAVSMAIPNEYSSEAPYQKRARGKGSAAKTGSGAMTASGGNTFQIPPLPPKPQADKLMNNGVTLRQLLSFYDTHANNGAIEEETTTSEVVKNIIIPQTCDPPRCYMETPFMQGFGGGHRATMLVSHTWQAPFVTTVLNIVLDATELPAEELVARDIRSMSRMEYGCYCLGNGALDAKKLLERLENRVLEKSYWLCIFAVNQHRAICGNCPTCSGKSAWVGDTAKHLAADPCLICKKRKPYPCSCGSQKLQLGQVGCEIDQLPSTLNDVEGVVVSLDPHLLVLKRIWVLAEIGHAIQCSMVHFRLALGLSSIPSTKLVTGRELVVNVEDGEASSREDKSRLLSDIKILQSNIGEADMLINCMLELQLGRGSRLQHITEKGKHVLVMLKHLNMDFRWNRNMEEFSKKLLGGPRSFALLRNLRSIELNCGYLGRLSSTDCLGEHLAVLTNLASLTLHFNDCVVLTSIEDLVELRTLIQLQSLTLNFSGCLELKDVSALWHGIRAMSSLEDLSLGFKYTQVRDVSDLGDAIKECRNMMHLYFDLEHTQIREPGVLSALADALKDSPNRKALKSFALALRQSKISSILQRNFSDQKTFLQIFRRWEGVNAIVERGFQEGAARDALESARYIDKAVKLLQEDVGKIVAQGFTEEQARQSLDGWDSEGKALKAVLQFLNDMKAIIDAGFTETEAWETLHKFASKKNSLERSLRVLKVAKVKEQGFTEGQAVDALKVNSTWEAAAQWLQDIRTIVQNGFTEAEAQDALARKGSGEEALRWLRSWSQKSWRCFTCRCMRMRGELSQLPDEARFAQGSLPGQKREKQQQQQRGQDPRGHDPGIRTSEISLEMGNAHSINSIKTRLSHTSGPAQVRSRYGQQPVRPSNGSRQGRNSGADPSPVSQPGYGSSMTANTANSVNTTSFLDSGASQLRINSRDMPQQASTETYTHVDAPATHTATQAAM